MSPVTSETDVGLAGASSVARPAERSLGPGSAGDPSTRSRMMRSRWAWWPTWPNVLGLAWVVGAGIALLIPALVHGAFLGPYSILAKQGLTAHPASLPANYYNNEDLIDSLIPWTDMAWRLVHQGHLPLWNAYGGLGMPLAFNWQSAPFALGALVGYLAPLHYAFTVSVVVNVIIAGTGAYFLGRVLGLGAVGAATVGTVFELSGPFAAWLGYSFASVICWSGWIFALGILVMRGRHRGWSIAGLAVCVAFAAYGGQPEGLTVTMTMVGLFFVVMLLSRAEWLGGSGPIFRPLRDLVVSVVGGLCLAAPLLLPALQLTRLSVRSGSVSTQALPARQLLYLPFQGYDALPTTTAGFLGLHRSFIGMSWIFYTQSAAYVGVTALVLAVLALFLRRSRPEVKGFAVVAVVCLAIVFFQPATTVVVHIPGLKEVGWLRALMPLALAIAALAGFGTDAIARDQNTRRIAAWVAGAFAVAALFVLVIWLFGQGHITSGQRAVRAQAFVWPTVEVIVGLGAGAVLLASVRRPAGSPSAAGPKSDPRWLMTGVALALLASQTAFLLVAGAPEVQSSSTWFPNTPATQKYVADVGTATVGFGASVGILQLGIGPNINGVYGVHEFDIYDPIVPARYFKAWASTSQSAPGLALYNLFSPIVSSASEAREFGIGYILVPEGTAAPTGTVFVGNLDDELLYRVPNAGHATVTPLVNGDYPPDDAEGTPVSVGNPNSTNWTIETSSDVPVALRLHLTNVPGWRATIDGRPLALHPYNSMMLQAKVPAGRHVVQLSYWPKTLTLGIALAVLSILGLAAYIATITWRRRRDGSRPTARAPSRREPVSAPG
jgi:hypothetical protein